MWIARGLWAILWCPDNNSQVKKSLWTYRHRRSQWGKNQKCFLMLPNVHKEVLPNSVSELFVTPTSRMGILGTFGWPCSPCHGYKTPSCKSGLYLPVVFPVQRIVLGNSWSPGIWGQFLQMEHWTLPLGIPVGSLAIRNWFNYADYESTQEEGSGGHPGPFLFHLFCKCLISLHSPQHTAIIRANSFSWELTGVRRDGKPILLSAKEICTL